MTEPHPVPSLRSRVVNGIAWSAGAAVAVQASRLAFGLVLARLLTPHEYGIAGMALVFGMLVLGVSDMGLGAGLVQRASITEADRSTVFWTSVAIGCVLAAIGIASAGPVAGFFGEPDVAPLFAAVSVAFVVTALGRTHAALLQRDMAFRAISLRMMCATAVGGATGVALAVLDQGAWALVGMHIANGVTATALMWLVLPWRPKLLFSRASLRDLGGFGLNVFGAKIGEYLHRNADKVIVGRALGSSSLGFYNVAYNFVVVPYVALLVALIDTLFPAMSRMQSDPARVGAAWLRASRILVAIATPAMAGLAVVAPEFVLIVLGEQWKPAIGVVQVVAVAMAVNSLTALDTTVLTALDRTGTVLRFTLAEVAVIVVALLVGLEWGIVGVAAGYLVALTLTRTVLALLAAHAVGITLWASLRPLAGPLQATLAMTAAVWLAREGMVAADVHAAARLVLLPAIGVLAYMPLCAWRCPDLAAAIKRVLLRRTPLGRHRASAPVAP